MRRYWKLGLAIGVAIAAMVVAVVVYPRHDRQEMLDVTREWGRLAPFPAEAAHLSVSPEGSSFSRGFRASFQAAPAVIEKWLSDSPGTQHASPKRPRPGVRHFDIAPGGGAQYAEVTVDDTTHIVQIYVYWS